jgi:hypothetical protein
MRWLFGEYGIYEPVPNAPPNIKKYVAEKCSRFVNEAAVSFEEVAARE